MKRRRKEAFKKGEVVGEKGGRGNRQRGKRQRGMMEKVGWKIKEKRENDER